MASVTEQPTRDDAADAPPVAKILAVDDDEANLFALQSVLGDLGQPIVCARSGEEALRLLLKDEYAIILLDVRMPGMDGYETAGYIRARSRTRHIPIIFLSAIDKDKIHMFRGYAAGAVDYVFKPIEPVVLRAKVGVFIDLHAKAQEIRRQAEMEKRLLEENLRMRAQQWETADALQRSLAQQSLVIDALPIALFVAAARDRYRSRRFVGGDMGALLQMSQEQLAHAQKRWLQRIHESDRPRVEAALDKFGKAGSTSIEYRYKCGDGSFRWFFERISPVAGEDGNDGDMVGLMFDISSRKAMQEQLAHAQKMEAIGQMTGSIAHDFNNMLSVIIGSLDRPLQQEDLDPRLRKRLDLSMQAALSCADLTKRLLGFGRRQPLEPRTIRLADELAGLDLLFRRLLGSRVEFEIDCPAKVWTVHLDPSQLEAAIVNLAINARDAMPGGGKLRIAAQNVPAASRPSGLAELQADNFVELCVTDTGVGMNRDVRRRAMEPFFTTKTSGHGTGLGLSSVHEFIRQSGGAMDIDSEVGKGTTIRLYMPRTRQAHPSRAARTKNGDTPTFEHCRVLVVEDEDKVREMTAAMLESLGCDVVTATNGDSALAMEANLGDINVLLTDCVMNGKLDGPALAAELARRRPGLSILLTSGNVTAASLPDTPRTRFLPKPYSQSQLARTLADMMA